VDYSLFMAVSMVLMAERLEKRPGLNLAAFPLPIFVGIAYVSMFHVPRYLLLGTSRGGVFI
jgi:hypothetical protein